MTLDKIWEDWIWGLNPKRRERRLRRSERDAITRLLRGLGLLDGPGPDEGALLRGCLSFLSASATEMLLVNLEDLWLETESQNIPGTSNEHPNWLRKGRYSFEEFRELPGVVDMLHRIDVLRKRKGGNAVAA